VPAPDPPVGSPVIPRAPLSLRAVLLGLFGAAVIAALTPYNDWALNNTFLIGNNLPLGAIMLAFLFTVFVGGPLSRLAPRHALSTGEAAVAFSLMLVACSIPSSGLMRYLPPLIVAPFWHARSDAEQLALLESMGLPKWLFPTFAGHGPREWINDPIVSGYYLRWTGNTPPPYLAWVTPIVTWGVFTFLLYGALLCLCAIVRRQWFENERLSFPLAQIQLTLVEQPAAGRFFNSVMGRKGFWIAFAAIFLIDAWNGLALSFPKYFPPVPFHYDLASLVPDPPLTYTEDLLKSNTAYFSVVGVTYFIPGKIAFSLWFFYLLHNLRHILLGVVSGDPGLPNLPGMGDERNGGYVAFAIAVLWVGRHHWRLVFAQAFRGWRSGEPRGRYLSYPTAFWGLVACAIGMVLWLVLAGSQWVVAIVAVLILLFCFLIITRFVAEAGLVHGQLSLSLTDPWRFLAVQGHANLVSNPSIYLASTVQSVHFDYRETLPVYATHGMKIADTTVFADQPSAADRDDDRRTGRRLIAAYLLSLLVAYLVSFSSVLWTEYHYASSLDVNAVTPINNFGTDVDAQVPFWVTNQYKKGQYNLNYSPATHMGIGFVVAGFLSWMRLRYTSWPLHPIGYLLLGSFPAAHFWFSFFVGWLLKTLILRLGGARLYTSAKPVFFGLIVGEAAAAGLWLLLGILLSAMHVPYRPVNIMPT
jgi:hypothetical protein